MIFQSAGAPYLVYILGIGIREFHVEQSTAVVLARCICTVVKWHSYTKTYTWYSSWLNYLCVSLDIPGHCRTNNVLTGTKAGTGILMYVCSLRQPPTNNISLAFRTAPYDMYPPGPASPSESQVYRLTSVNQPSQCLTDPRRLL